MALEDSTLDFDGVDDEVATFLADLHDTKVPEKKKPEAEAVTEADVETDVDAPETAEDGAETGTDEPDTETAEKKDEETSPDDAEVTFKIGDAETKVRMSELKGMVEERAAFTARTQALAQEQQSYVAGVEKAQTALNTLLEKAQARFKPYADLDWVKAQATMDDAAYETLKAMAREARDDVAFLSAELDANAKAAQETQATAMRRATAEAVKVLEGPADKGGIEGFGPKLYNEMIDFAVSAGVPREAALAVVDPAAMRIIHKAMLYDRGQASKATAAAKIKAAPVKPMAVARPAANGNPKAPARSDREAALARLRRSGSMDAAADAFLADLRGDADDA